jgi:hypothetical protein
MKRKSFLIMFVLLVLLAMSSFPALASPVTLQISDVLTFGDFQDVGDSWLQRNDNVVVSMVNVNGADPGVYTMWWIVWNTPEGCYNPYACDEPDLFNPYAGLAIGYAGGAVVGPNGELKVTAKLTEGDTLTGFAYPEFQAIGVQLTETTMINVRHAEVHLVLRNHGEKEPGLVGEAMHTFNGGCVYDPPINGSEPAYGTPGPNTCFDPYFTVFPSEDAP